MTRLLTTSLAAALLIAACGGGDEPATAPEKQRTAAANVENPAARSGRRHATFVLGDQSFELDVVTCLALSVATYTANDSQKRLGYPVVTVKMYDPVMTGGQSHDTVSAYIEHDGYAANWTLNDGTIDKTDGGITASGTLSGVRLVKQPDGSNRSAPLASDAVQSFELHIRC